MCDYRSARLILSGGGPIAGEEYFGFLRTRWTMRADLERLAVASILASRLCGAHLACRATHRAAGDKAREPESIDRGLRARGTFVQVQPSPLDVAAHDVNLPVCCIAIACAKLVKGGDEAVGFLILTFAFGEDFLARSPFQVVDVGLIDIELQQKFA